MIFQFCNVVEVAMIIHNMIKPNFTTKKKNEIGKKKSILMYFWLPY